MVVHIAGTKSFKSSSVFHALSQLFISSQLIITLSSKGCQHKNKIYPVKKVQIRDVSGAGDTFLSGLVAEYIRTNNIEQAIIFAQKCTDTNCL